MLGLILGAPLTSAAIHISGDLALARARAEARPTRAETEPPHEGGPIAAASGASGFGVSRERS